MLVGLAVVSAMLALTGAKPNFDFDVVVAAVF